MEFKKAKGYDGTTQYVTIYFKNGGWCDRTVYEDEEGLFYVKINGYLFKVEDLLNLGDKVSYYTK